MGQNMGNIWAKTDHEHVDRDISYALEYFVIIFFPLHYQLIMKPYKESEQNLRGSM